MHFESAPCAKSMRYVDGRVQCERLWGLCSRTAMAVFTWVHLVCLILCKPLSCHQPIRLHFNNSISVHIAFASPSDCLKNACPDLSILIHNGFLLAGRSHSSGQRRSHTCVAHVMGFPILLQRPVIIFWAMKTFSVGISMPRSPRATMMPSLTSRISSNL